MKAIEYSRFMLAFCLDTEIDAAAWFLKVIDPEPALLGGVWVTREYLIFLYQHWRTITYRFPEEVPDGAFLMGALILGKKVKIMGALETSWAIRVKRFKLSEVETTLKRLYDMPEFEGEKYFRS